jgi:predicted dehydrogenase
VNVAIVGCGLIGEKRLKAMRNAKVTVCCDSDAARASRLAGLAGARSTTDWREAVGAKDVDSVIVATTNAALAPVSLGAIAAGRHVLVEKPGAMTVAQLQEMDAAARTAGVVVQVGFNHRYHAALSKAREIVDSGALGPLMFVRGRYGHGGRVGYNKEWRADPALSGGGELMDQGVHLIDLAGWFLGEFPVVEGFAGKYFWDMPVDDNAFLTLRTKSGQCAWLHVSCSEWKNMFSFEIYGRDGKLAIDGLGGSYGLERLTWYKMLPQMGPPETTSWEYPGADPSWEKEWEVFTAGVSQKRVTGADVNDALRAMRVVETVYGNGGVRDYRP